VIKSPLRIPCSSVEISRLGFGCARLGDGNETRASSRLIEVALRHGITHFDTAPMYGSEDLLGAILGDSPGATIATKVGIPRSTAGSSSTRWARAAYRRAVRPVLSRFPRLKRRLLRTIRPAPPATTSPIKRILDRAEVLRELEESLRRLRRSRIDIYLIHEPEQFQITEELMEVFEQLQRHGTIGAFGLAYGGPPPEGAVRFGSVEQCRYAAHLDVSKTPHSGFIFHGVLRHGLSPPNRARQLDPGQLVLDVLREHEQAAVVFSASSVHQIAQIGRVLQQDS
jgi:aryl-alcohol dehydrogenase-like predicted oxidoreductase